MVLACDMKAPHATIQMINTIPFPLLHYLKKQNPTT